MKKVKVLSHPAQVDTIRLDDLDYNTQDETTERMVRLQVRRWRKLRHGLV